MAFALSGQARLLLVRLTADRRNDAYRLHLMLRTGHLLRPASHPASQPRTGASLPGTLASPQAGLTPAGYPQLVAQLRHNNLLVVMAPKLLDAPTKRRLGVRGSVADEESVRGDARAPYRRVGAAPPRRIGCRSGAATGGKDR